VTQLDGIVYAVCEESSIGPLLSKKCIIKMYKADTLSPLDESIHITGMRYPRDIVACHRDRQLYVGDLSCIWRVSVDNKSSVKWVTDQLALRIYKLSVTSHHILVTLSPCSLRQYSTTDKPQLHEILLPSYVVHAYHSVETVHQTFIVGHKGTFQKKKPFEVSDLFTFCHMFKYHHVRSSFLACNSKIA